MSKKLLHKYTFNKATKTIVLDGIHGRERLLMISNVTRNVVMYLFNNVDLGLTSYSINVDAETTTLVLTIATSTMANTDELQIFIESDSAAMVPDATFTDPVSKLRVSTPENLIDTDFEYGLQSTKWETLELVKNIPTFYSRNGDADLDVTAITRTNGSQTIAVTTEQNHGLSVGNPIIVQGTNSVSANGAFIVTSIPSTTTFQYRAKSTQNATGSILDTYSQVFVASVYQGTEFQLTDLNAVTTNAAVPSNLTVTTKTPTNFTTGTSFFLSNSVGSKNISFNAASTTTSNTRKKQETVTALTDTHPTDTSEWSIGSVQPYNWTPKKGMFMIIGGDADATVNFNTVTDELEFTTNHPFTDGEPVMWLLGQGNTNPGGIAEQAYWVRTTADPKKIYLTSGGSGSISRVDLTGQGINAGMMKSCLAAGLKPSAINTTTDVITFDTNIVSYPADTPYLVMYTTLANFNVIGASAGLQSQFEGQATPYAYYLKGLTATTANFSITASGTNFDLTTTTTTGIFIPMKKQSEGDHNSFYLPRGGWVDGDVVLFNSTGTPTGITNDGIYQLQAVNAFYPNRYRLFGYNRNPANGLLAEMTDYGGVGTTIHSFYETQPTLKNQPTGETGSWNLGSVNPMNWLPDEAFFFVGGVGANSTIAVNAGTDIITFTTAHGLIDNKPYVYFAGPGNGVIGGLTDSRWYYVRVVNSTQIYLTLTEGSTTKVDLTTAGTSYDSVRSCFIKGYRASTCDGAADTVTFIDAIPGITSGGSQHLMACYTTFANITVFSSSGMLMSYTPGSGQVVYPKTVSANGLVVSFTQQVNGATMDLDGGAVNAAIMIKVSPDPTRNSIWFPNHGFQSGDVVQYYDNSTNISGMASTEWYRIIRVNDHRVSFQYRLSTDPVDFGDFGNAVATVYNHLVDKTIVASGDFLVAPNHGLNDKDSVFYNSSGGLAIDPLVSGTTYYVQNAAQNQFQLSTTFSGTSGTEITVPQTTGDWPSSSVINYTAHPFLTGDRVRYVSSTPVSPLQSGAYYYIWKIGANQFSLHLNYDGASINNERTRVYFAYPYSGTGTFVKTTAVDLYKAGTGTQSLNATAIGSSDGVYQINSIVNDNQFTLGAPGQIPARVVNFSPLSSVWHEQDAIRIPDHYFVSGQAVTYGTSGTAVGGLVDSTTYYVIRVSRDWIRLATTFENATISGTYINLTSTGTGTHTLTTNSITGEVIGGGTISVDTGSMSVVGTNTNFTSFFNTGDAISFYKAPTTVVVTVTSIDTGTSILTTGVAHGLSTEMMIVMNAATAPAGTVNGQIYYVRNLSSTTFALHNTAAAALANTGRVSITDAGDGVVPFRYTDLGVTYSNIVKAVTGSGSLSLLTASPAALVDCNFTVGTSLLMRADGFAIHRPYDGGVELIPSKNPDSRMIRQTRRYFRYQSGKGIQVSFAVNFSPSTQIDDYSASGATATIKTRSAHRLAVGLTVLVRNAVTTDAINYWNGEFTVASIIDDYTFTVTLLGTPTNGANGPTGIPEFNVHQWNNSALRCGLFDDQNGLYFEFDGQKIKACRRNATTQISGVSAVTFRSGLITGTGTKYSKQLNVGDSIVVKGQTYLVTKINSDTSMAVLPSYRGVSNTGVVVTKVIDVKVNQEDWSLDKCDGTGPSGFYLRNNRIQMAYMDYSWYGAGKVRFGFKDQYGKVIYAHEFIHNNRLNEAYMRSGNVPARYEIENIGTPTYVPALAHWGTSVIMDGGFDADNAYQFTASSQDVQLTGQNTVTVAANAEENDDYFIFFRNNWYNIGRALNVGTPSFLYNSIPNNVSITGANIPGYTLTRAPYYWFELPNQPYQVSLRTRRGNPNASNTEAIRNLILINQAPSAETATVSNYTATLSTTGQAVVYDIPLISIRLSPSVDTNTPGYLGEREIINRMQLILSSVGILSTHNCIITLRLNGLITNTDWKRVQNPSLSQLIYHTNKDLISGGIDIFNFRAQGGTGATNRSAFVTTQLLPDISTLGNSILGGDNVFPDGPDVLTVVAKLSEDPSTVSSTNPFNVTGRISWTESQA